MLRAKDIPAPTPLLTQSLSQHECEDHRARLAIEVEIVLDGYWQTRPGAQMKAAILADWMDELEDWHIDQIRCALRKWRSENPSKKPNPGHIVALLKGQRGAAFAAERKNRTPDPLFAIGRLPALEAAE
jgi:hypothetical protein